MILLHLHRPCSVQVKLIPDDDGKAARFEPQETPSKAWLSFFHFTFAPYRSACMRWLFSKTSGEGIMKSGVDEGRDIAKIVAFAPQWNKLSVGEFDRLCRSYCHTRALTPDPAGWISGRKSGVCDAPKNTDFPTVNLRQPNPQQRH